MLLLVILASALGVALDQPCRGESWGNGTTQFSRACYSDIVHLYWGRGIGDGVVPYVGDPSTTGDEPVEYPVLTGVTMWVLSFPVPDDWQFADRGRLYFDINAIAIALLAAVTVWATAKTARSPSVGCGNGRGGSWFDPDLNHQLGSLGGRLDVASHVGLGAPISRDRGHLAGTWLPLTSFTRCCVLGPLFVLCLRAGRLKPFCVALLATVVTWLAANLPIMFANFDGWARFYELSRERGADFGSIWLVFEGWGLDLSVARLNLLGTVLFASLCIAIALLGLMAPRRPRLRAVGIPDHRCIPTDQQGVLTSVRAVVDSARCAGTATMARLHLVAGSRSRLLLRGLVVHPGRNRSRQGVAGTRLLACDWIACHRDCRLLRFRCP